MTEEKRKVLDLLWNEPIRIGHWVGFTDLTQLHNEWLRSFLYNDEDQTLQGHRGSYKTTTLSLFFALNLILNPNKTALFFRKTGGDVSEVIRTTSNILKSGCMREIVRILYGRDLILIKESSSSIDTNLGTSISGSSQLVGLGIGTSITGKHADIVVTDDIVNVNDRVSKAERDRTKLAYQELINICNRGGRFINTGTPWHKDDCFTLMPNIRKFTYKDTGLISDEQAEELRKSMTASLFAANYELRHVAEEDVIFYNPQTGADIERAKGGWSHLDSAYYGEDYNAYTALNIHDGKWYVYGRCWHNHIDDIIDLVADIDKDMRSMKLHNELNADKGYVAKELRKRGIKVGTYTESQNKYIKITSYLKFEWHDVIFVNGTDQEYIDMICDYNENAEHDDCPDSLASLIRIYQKKKQRQAEAIKV